MTADPGILLAALRRATAPAHEALHHPAALQKLPTKDVTRNDYLGAITKFYGFYVPLENAYAASRSGWLVDFPALVIVQNLEHDLQRHGISPQSLPVAAQLPALHCEEAVAAYLYMREGSNLGGRVISKNLERVLGLQPEVDNRFFWGAGDKMGENWKHFLARLDAAGQTLDVEKCAGYAAALFAALDDWMTRGKRAEKDVA